MIQRFCSTYSTSTIRARDLPEHDTIHHIAEAHNRDCGTVYVNLEILLVRKEDQTAYLGTLRTLYQGVIAMALVGVNYSRVVF